MECKRCLMTDEVTRIHKDGECDFCKMHDKLEGLEESEFFRIVEKIKKQKGYQVLIGISGGFDSSYLLWYTVWVLRIKPLVLHFDNKWNDPIAEHNMNVLLTKLNIDLIRIASDKEYDLSCGALLEAGVKDADITNDMYMADLMQTVAYKYKIKYIFNGHDFRNEGSAPLAWTYMDAKYMKSVYKSGYGKKMTTPHIQTFWKQIVAAMRGIKQIRVYHYLDIPTEERVNTLIEFGLLPYKEKHGENIYTKWVGYFLLPMKWGIDKRKVYLSAQIRSGYITKEEAKEKLKEKTLVGINILEMKERTGTDPQRALDAPEHTYKDFKHYHFKRYKPLLWLLAKLHLTSYQFYKKYSG